MNKIAILVTTMGREDMLEKAITSMIKYRPENTVILIGDQGLKNIDIVKKEKYENKGCYFYTLPYDCGLSKARNYLVERADEMGCNYCIIASDSMFFTEKTKQINLLINHMEVYDCIGCKLNGNVPAYWVGWLTLVPGKYFEIDFINRQSICNAPNGIFDCSIIHNFFIAKTSSLLAVKWDNNLKLAEHEDFFYRYTQHGYKVGWTDIVSCDYERSHGDISMMRQLNWNNGIHLLTKKYQIKSWIHYKNLLNGKFGTEGYNQYKKDRGL